MPTYTPNVAQSVNIKDVWGFFTMRVEVVYTYWYEEEANKEVHHVHETVYGGAGIAA